MSDESNGVNKRKHPNPLTFLLIPYKQLLQIFVNENIDGIVKRNGFVDRMNGGIDGHAVVGRIFVEYLGEKILKTLLCYKECTIWLLLLWEFSSSMNILIYYHNQHIFKIIILSDVAPLCFHFRNFISYCFGYLPVYLKHSELCNFLNCINFT